MKEIEIMEFTELLKHYEEERRRRDSAIDRLGSASAVNSMLEARRVMEATVGSARLSAVNALIHIAEHQRTAHSAMSRALASVGRQAVSQHADAVARLIFGATRAGSVATHEVMSNASAQAAKALFDSRNSLSMFTATGALSALAALRPGPGTTFFDHLEAIRDEVEALRNSFAHQVADEVQAAIGPEEIGERAVERIEQLFDGKIESLPRGRVSAQGLEITLALLSMVLSIVIAAYQSAESAATSEAQLQQLTQIRTAVERMAAKTERLLPAEEQETYYLVDREVKLRAAPRAKAHVVSSLSPGLLVRLAQPKHEWIYVEYFDHVEGVPKYAWAQKKYFRRVVLP
jgi:hypothetical protein